ncbi:tetratricopeptide repeat protein [Oleiharenicola sp. Vm1]|uniref:tetratricopeptide repeat protein n=1 Tax=Oleiharenicola sp. Vm1 TaxID=3398393 RepID=UPI0039F53815
MSSLTTRFSVRACAALAAALFAGSAFAQQQERNYSLSEETSEVLSTTYKTAAEAKNYDAALKAVDDRLAKLKDATSFDAAVLLQVKAQTYLQKSDFINAIAPLEQALQLSDSHTPAYFEDRTTTEFLFFLAQLYFQEAANSKNASTVAGFYDKADAYMARWMKLNKKPNPDALLFYASLIFNRAAQDQDHPDVAAVKRALEIVDKAMRMSTHPKDNLYLLKLVCLQHLNRNAEAVELLELLVKQHPDNKNYWQQLAALYLGQQQDIRAILAFERAQANGFMNSPKDNFNLVGIHFNIGQYERAAELLEKGLHNGSIENEEKNWELLAYSYQQLNRDFKAIDTLKEATKVFPKSNGQLEYLIAQNYYTMEKLDEALPYLQASVKKGGGNKPHSTYLFLAFIAYELKKFDIALDGANRAIATPEGKAEGQRMKQAIEDLIKEREAKAAKAL